MLTPDSSSITEPPYKLAVIVASLGGIEAVSTVVRHLPSSLPLALAVLIHRPADLVDHLPAILRRATAMQVRAAEHDDRICAGHIYVAPGGLHLVVNQDHTFGLSSAARVRHVRPAGDVLLVSAAAAFGRRLIAIVLTGGDGDGADGMVEVRRLGGRTIVQIPETAVDASMPRTAIATGAVDHVMSLRAIGPEIERLAAGAVD